MVNRQLVPSNIRASDPRPLCPSHVGTEAPEGLAGPDIASDWPLLLQPEENPVKVA